MAAEVLLTGIFGKLHNTAARNSSGMFGSNSLNHVVVSKMLGARIHSVMKASHPS